MPGKLTCTGCGTDNRAGASFCGTCGARLLRECRSCGAEVPDGLRFCDQCGAPTDGEPVPTAPATLVSDRKVVTVVFADLSGSTQMQERLDAEATARMMDRLQRALSSAVEANGGRVVKSTGDGLMAVFGVPVVREDDAVRAVRAGMDMQEAFSSLGLDGVALRVGVNTGEVVVSPNSVDVVGDPVNVAARLEAAAGLGEIYIGPETNRLVRDLIAVEPVSPLTLKGKANPVTAARVVGAAPPAPSQETPFLGRDREIAGLLAVLDDAVGARAARLATVIAWPGLGKSRLATELTRRIRERADIVEVRFVADAGSSFGPIAQAVRNAVDPTTLDLGPDSERVGATIAALCGGLPAGSTEQVFWAIRRALEGLAASRPVVMVLDDVHWAEPAMLDLLEHLAEWMRDAPVLLLALARLELRDIRPSLVDVSGPSSSVFVLDGLDEDASRRLALEVLDTEELPEGVLSRTVDASEGNPLFLRELLRLLVDDGVLVRDAGRWELTVEVDAIEMPATIHAALAARIEQLSPEERLVLQAASVVGRHFPRGAVAALLEPGLAARLDEHLSSLHRRALVDSEGTWWQDERMFRFHHVLIRDAAYRRVLKEVRVDHHVRYADWLMARAGDDVSEHDEVLAFHLEQALRCRADLGDPIDDTMVDRAVGHLATAGRRALDIDDLANAASLLGRALDLRPNDVDLLRDRCEALVAGGNVHQAADVVAALASSAHDDWSRAWADVFDAQLATQGNPEALRDVADRAAAAAAVFATQGDDVGVAKAESVAASALGRIGQVAACEAALDRSLAAARRAGNTRLANVVLSIAPTAALWGPSPIARASGRCLDVVRVLRITSWAPHVEAHALRCQAVLEAMRDRADAARRMLDNARTTFTDLGHRWGLLEAATDAGVVELLAGNPAEAEHHLRQAVDGFHALGARTRGAQAVALLAKTLLDLGRIDEAATLADPTLAGDDLKASIGLLGVAAEISAQRGEIHEAIALARRAVALAEPTDALVDHADARLALANALDAAGRAEEAAAERARARELYEAKGCSVGVRRTGTQPAPASAEATLATRRRVHRNATPARRIRPNLVTETSRRMATAIRDADAHVIDDLVGSSYHEALRATVPGSDAAATLRYIARANGSMMTEALATMGHRHALERVTFSFTDRAHGGATEDVALIVTRVDESGRVARQTRFDDADLAPALARLVEWSADELEEPRRERARQSAQWWSFGQLVATRQWDAYRALVTDDAMQIDHRPGGAGEVVGADAMTEWIRELAEIADVVRPTVADVLALTPDAALWHNVVTGRTVDGGLLEIASYAVARFAEDGRVMRAHLFPLDQLDDAWKCFDAAAVPRPPRRVRANLATEMMDRLVRAVDAGDRAVLTDLLVDEFVRSDHALRADEDRDAQLRSMDTLIDFGAHIEADAIATLGRRHGLARLRMVWPSLEDGGTTELARLYIGRTDEDGRIRRLDHFPDNDLAAALGCLMERWAEDELTGVEQARARRAAAVWSFADAAHAGDWERYRSLYSRVDEVIHVDHRPTGVDEIRGPDAATAWLRELAASVDDMRIDVHDVLALTPCAALWHNVVTGSRSGGPYSIPSYVALRFGRDGGTARVDFFPVDRLDEAWACFDAYAAGPRRRIGDNLATATLPAWLDAVTAGDSAALAQLYDPAFVSTVRGLHTEAPLADHLATLEAVVDVHVDVLAVIGERHSLNRVRLRWTTGVETERDGLFVVRVGTDGRYTRFDAFESRSLAAAVRCLIERWAEEELDGASSCRANAIAASCELTAPAVAGDWGGFGALFAPGAMLVDHRGFSGEVVGRSAIVDWLRRLLEPATSLASGIVDVLALTPHAAVFQIFTSGMVDGNVFEMTPLAVMRFGEAGTIERLDVFSSDDVDAAFDVLDRVPSAAGSARRVTPNRASAVIATWESAMNDGDSARAAALYSAGYVLVRHDQHLSEDRETWLTTEHELIGCSTLSVEPIATIGERHALSRVGFDLVDQAGGHVRTRALFVASTDGADRVEREDMFADSDLGNALACLIERWARDELDGAERERALRRTRLPQAREAARQGDWTLFRNVYTPDVVFVDHRPAGVTISGVNDMMAWYGSMGELADEFATDAVDVLGLTPERTLLQVRVRGVRDGGPFNLETINLAEIGRDGRIARIDAFGLDQRDEAWSWFDRPATSPPRVVHRNLAVDVAARWQSAAQRSDAEALAALHHPDFVSVNHFLQIEVPLAEHLADQRHLLNVGANIEAEPLAAIGERHVLLRVTMPWTDPVHGAVDRTGLYVARVASDGRILRYDGFATVGDGHPLDDAIACLLQRWTEDELDGAERGRGMTRAESSRLNPLASARNWAGLRALLHDEAVLADHRPAAAGAVHGPDAIVAWYREIAEQTTDLSIRTADVLGLTEDASLLKTAAIGARDGGPVEVVALACIACAPDGRLARIEVFSGGDVDDARACFESLNAAPNKAIAALSSWWSALARGDEPVALLLCADDAVMTGWRPSTHDTFVGDADIPRLIQAIRSKEGADDASCTGIGTIGNKLGVARLECRGGSDTVGALAVVQLDDEGRIARLTAFEPESEYDAFDLLWEWRLDSATSEREALAVVVELVRAYNARDLDRIRATFASNAEFIDHRSVGWGTIDLDAYMWNVGELFERTSEVLNIGVDALRIQPGFVVARTAIKGVQAEGGPFELELYGATSVRDGLITRMELFPLDALADVLACSPLVSGADRRSAEQPLNKQW